MSKEEHSRGFSPSLKKFLSKLTPFQKGLKVRLKTQIPSSPPHEAGEEGKVIYVDSEWVEVEFKDGIIVAFEHQSAKEVLEKIPHE